MSAGPAKILLVENRLREAQYLEERLRRWSCDFQLATSIEQARKLLAGRTFDLILSCVRLSDGSAYGLIEQVLGKSTTMFFSHAVQDGCWWVPVLENGCPCSNGALRSTEFLSFLDSFFGRLSPEAVQPKNRSAGPEQHGMGQQERIGEQERVPVAGEESRPAATPGIGSEIPRRRQ